MLKFNVEVITPAVAAEYLKMNQFNRKPNKGQVAYYAKMMSDGQWELNGEAIKFAINGHLIDGQHRLMACVESNVPFETAVAREVEEKAFDTFDQGWLRKKSQIFSIKNIPNSVSIASAITKFLAMKNSKITSLHSAIVGRGGNKKTSPREALDCYNESPQYWQELHKTASAMYGRCKLWPASDISATAAHLNKTCGYELGFVIDFFEQLFYEERTELGIIRVLRQRLINDALSTIKMTSQHKTQLIRKVWDCYKEHKDPQVLKWVKGVEEEKPFS